MQKKISFTPEGVCCRNIYIEQDREVIKQVTFVGGCHGNLQGLSALVRGQRVVDVIERLQGIKCNSRLSSCPDQLAIALKRMLLEEGELHGAHETVQFQK